MNEFIIVNKQTIIKDDIQHKNFQVTKVFIF